MRTKPVRVFRLAVLVAVGFFAACAPQQGPEADLVLKIGAIYTVDGARSRAEAVAVKDGVFLYVGTNNAAGRYVGEKTKVTDLGGKLVLPGFIDAHCHPSAAVEQFGSAALFGLRSVADYQKAVREFIAAHPGLEAVRGSGWSNTVFDRNGPRKEALDAVVADIPAALSSEDGHSIWVNTKTLELAGVTKGTRDPPGGVIERDPKTGEPSGTLRESAARLVGKVIPDFTADEIARGLEEYQKMALGFGITTAHEASLDRDGNSLAAYKELEREGNLKMRFRASLYADPEEGIAQVAALEAERAKNIGPLFRTGAAKIFVDGVVEGSTAFLKEPYIHKPGFRGTPLWSPEVLDALCVALDKAGFQLHFHVIGDAAAAEALDGIAAAAKANGPRDARPLLTHLQLVAPADILRFKDLGAVAVPQPYWFMKDDYYSNLQVPYLGRERADAEYPMESFFKAGVPVASSSDYTVTIPCDPLQAIQIGMTRRAPGTTGPDDVLWPEERATLEQMIASFTIFGAYANFLEKETGSIEQGKSADLVVLDRDLFGLSPDDVGKARVVMTLFRGREARAERYP
ncbi:MAG TPA: amidohydrolase [Acidobacteriota bacterium]|nr:amidohydrolase [Acidobacteriota bacterium]